MLMESCRRNPHYQFITVHVAGTGDEPTPQQLAMLPPNYQARPHQYRPP